MFVSFTLLTPESYLVSTLPIYSSSPTLETHIFQSGNENPALVASYLLPQLADGETAIPGALDIRPDPPSSNGPFIHTAQGRAERRLFTTDPFKGVVALDMVAGGRGFQMYMLKEMFVKDM